MAKQTVVEKASKMGFIPKEDWKGDPDQWRPAEEFVERGENIIPILKERLDKSDKKIEELTSDIKITLAANKREAEEARQAGYAKAKAEFDAKKKALDKKEKKAFKAGDEELYEEVKEEQAALQEPEKPAEPGPEKKVAKTDPVFEDWSAKEKWYTSDPDLAREADIQGNAIAKAYPDAPFEKILEMTATNVKKLHPDKFKNARREDPDAVEAGDNGSPPAGKKNFASLPQSAKDAYKRVEAQFKMKGRVYKKEEYATDWHNQ